MINSYEGDPRLVLTNNGVTLTIKGGQPVMDQGFENQAQIGLLSGKGWAGNIFLTPDQQIGSDFVEIAKGSITLAKLNDIKQAAEKDLASPAFGNVVSTVKNPESNFLRITSVISPPGKDQQELILLRNGTNWINQAINPAYRRL